ncbi:MAG TPA: hypothetical protein VE988_13580 [Gemmataceae bacterium]|nr:hypothetical protein [Gemmataceae bacterium]
MKKLFAITLVVLSFTTVTSAWEQGVKEPKHLTDARALLKKLDLSKTAYELGKGKITWTGAVESYCDCSGFVDTLFQHSYGYDEEQFKKWFGSKRPTAARYHDAIVDKTGFTRVLLVKDILPGDLLAIKYLVRKDNTGHIMVVSAAPQKMQAKEPTKAGTVQWQVKVIDSSKSGHGNTDTRYKKGADGKDHDGLGEGIFRIYADQQGKVAGFAWSTLKASKFMPPEEEDLVIGRLKVGFKPQ